MDAVHDIKIGPGRGKTTRSKKVAVRAHVAATEDKGEDSNSEAQQASSLPSFDSLLTVDDLFDFEKGTTLLPSANRNRDWDPIFNQELQLGDLQPRAYESQRPTFSTQIGTKPAVHEPQQLFTSDEVPSLMGQPQAPWKEQNDPINNLRANQVFTTSVDNYQEGYPMEASGPPAQEASNFANSSAQQTEFLYDDWTNEWLGDADEVFGSFGKGEMQDVDDFASTL